MSKKQTTLFDGTIQTWEIKKHSSLVQMGNITTLRERKTLNALIYIAKDQLKRQPEERRFTCDLWQIKRLTGWDDSNTVELKQALSNLVDTKIEYNILNKDKEIWSVFAVLAEARIEVQGSGKPTTVTFEFPSTVLWAIKHPRIYVKLNLLMLRGFTSKHSLALYEFLADYLNLSSFRCEADDFRRLMGIEEGQYPSFTMLRKRVLDVAVDEINDKSDIVVSYELERSGRKITAIVFRMERKKESIVEHGAESAIRDKLKSFWLKGSVIETLLENHDESYLRVNIAVVEEQYKKGKIKNVAGYLLKAFADDYSEQMKLDQSTTRPPKTPDLFDQESELRKEFENQRRAEVEKYLKELSEEEQSAIQNEFLAENKDNIWYQSVSKSKDFEHPMVQNIYFRFVASKHLPKKHHSYEDFKALRAEENWKTSL